jgi:hypothetical protein
MEHALDINRQTALAFTKKARQFLNLPRSLFECDVKKCNPKLYTGRRGAATIKRGKKALTIIKRADQNLAKLMKLLEV